LCLVLVFAHAAGDPHHLAELHVVAAARVNKHGVGGCGVVVTHQILHVKAAQRRGGAFIVTHHHTLGGDRRSNQWAGIRAALNGVGRRVGCVASRGSCRYREAGGVVSRHGVVVGTLVRNTRGLNGHSAGLAGRKVGVRVQREAGCTTAHQSRLDAADRAAQGVPSATDVHRLGKVHCHIGIHRHIAGSVGRYRTQNGGGSIRATTGGAGVGAQVREVVVGKTVPLNRRVEIIVGVGVACGHRRFAAQCVVGRADQAGAPLSGWVSADLAQRINNRSSFQQHNRVIAVVPAAGHGLLGLGQNQRVGAGIGQHKSGAGLHNACQIDGGACRQRCVEIHLHRVAAGRQVNG